MMDYNQDSTSILGSEKAPLSIDEFSVDLRDIEMISRLVSIKEHKHVESLSKDAVLRLDETCKILGLDKDQHRYLERTRQNCKEVTVVRAILHG